jgi:hypothetical protein
MGAVLGAVSCVEKGCVHPCAVFGVACLPLPAELPGCLEVASGTDDKWRITHELDTACRM